MSKTYTLKAKVWIYPGSAPWHFVTIPKKTTDEINKLFWAYKRGWGSLRVEATIGKTTWKTSMFPDRKTGTYLSPLKAEVRKREKIQEGDVVTVGLEIG